MRECKFCLTCKGRSLKQEEVLEEPVDVVVTMSQKSFSNVITANVECPHVGGNHGEECHASNPDSISIPMCAYSAVFPLTFAERWI